MTQSFSFRFDTWQKKKEYIHILFVPPLDIHLLTPIIQERPHRYAGQPNLV